MAILVQSNKKPSVSFLSQTGSIVTFNSQYAGLPLKACKVDFEDETGIDSLDFSATGKNLWGGLYMAKTFDGKTDYYNLDTVNKFFTFNRSVNDGTSWRVPLYTNFKPDRQYTLVLTCNLETTGKNSCLGILYTDHDFERIIITNDTKETLIVVTKSSKSVDCIFIDWMVLGNCYVYYDESGLFEGIKTSDDFVPFGDNKVFEFGKTVQNGSLNVLTGELTNNDTTPPEVINLGGMNIETLQGENNLFASTGDTTVQHIKIGG